MKSSNAFLQDALTLPFRDSNWATKFLIGAALIFAGSFIPILPTLVFLGYLYRIHHRVVIENNGPVLPEWDDLGKLLTDGLKYLAVLLVYLLPVGVLVGGGYAIIFGFSMLMPIAVMINEDAAPLMAILMMLGTFGGLVIIMLGLLFSIVVGVLIPAGLVHMSAKDELGAAFRVNEWGKILRANLGGYVVVMLLLMGLLVVTTFVYQFIYLTIILCCLLPFVMSAISYYLGVVSANLFADAYVNGQAKIGLPALADSSVD